jgi:NAD(P)-dependent dehydrogenase (short-subunit alcohol dehydrogenase family)
MSVTISDLTGKSVVITGAASGIGRAAAERFIKAGAKVMLCDLSPTVIDLASRFQEEGSQAQAVVGDAADPEIVERIVATAVQSFGGLDVMFANAGVTGGLDNLFEQTAATWAETLRVNTTGVFLAVQAAARRMVGTGRGSIICTASTAGLRSDITGMAYSASKAAVISIAQTAANQLAGTGVRVNAICPGLTETGMTQFMFDKARARGAQPRLAQLNPLRRGGDPMEVAEVVVFLASEAASYVNGQAIAVDGGYTSTNPVPERRPTTSRPE